MSEVRFGTANVDLLIGAAARCMGTCQIFDGTQVRCNVVMIVEALNPTNDDGVFIIQWPASLAGHARDYLAAMCSGDARIRIRG